MKLLTVAAIFALAFQSMGLTINHLAKDSDELNHKYESHKDTLSGLDNQ
jgi:hypothetical protein